MYFYTMKLRLFLDLSDHNNLLIWFYKSLRLSYIEIYYPLFVFSPGFTIQIFLEFYASATLL